MQNLEDLTYLELFQYYIKQHESNLTVPINNKKKQHYCLFEDLKIIVAFNQLSEIHQKDYRKLEEDKIVMRSYQSIKDRYQNYLQALTQDDLLLISNYLKSKGTEGYLLFSNPPNRKLITISENDPKFNEKKRLSDDENWEIRKKVKIQENNSLPKNDFDKFSIDELDEVLTILAQWKRAPKALIVEKLHQLSGNLDDLDNYLETLNETYCWLEEEDQLLAQAESKHSTEMRLLYRTKGLERVKRRIKYLQYDLPFELD